MEKRITIADMKISSKDEDVLIAEEIGSGMGLAIYDPARRVGGILHFLLPTSSIDRKIAEEMPLMFADTAIPSFFRSFADHGGQKDQARILAAGGADIMDSEDALNIGKQNYRALMDLLDIHGIRLDAEDIGGHINRDLKMTVHTGNVFLKTSRTRQEVKI